MARGVGDADCTSLELGGEGLDGVFALSDGRLESIGAFVDTAELESDAVRGARPKVLLNLCRRAVSLPDLGRGLSDTVPQKPTETTNDGETSGRLETAAGLTLLVLDLVDLVRLRIHALLHQGPKEVGLALQGAETVLHGGLRGAAAIELGNFYGGQTVPWSVSRPLRLPPPSLAAPASTPSPHSYNHEM